MKINQIALLMALCSFYSFASAMEGEKAVTFANEIVQNITFPQGFIQDSRTLTTLVQDAQKEGSTENINLFHKDITLKELEILVELWKLINPALPFDKQAAFFDFIYEHKMWISDVQHLYDIASYFDIPLLMNLLDECLHFRIALCSDGYALIPELFITLESTVLRDLREHFEEDYSYINYLPLSCMTQKELHDLVLCSQLYKKNQHCYWSDCAKALNKSEITTSFERLNYLGNKLIFCKALERLFKIFSDKVLLTCNDGLSFLCSLEDLKQLPVLWNCYEALEGEDTLVPELPVPHDSCDELKKALKFMREEIGEELIQYLVVLDKFGNTKFLKHVYNHIAEYVAIESLDNDAALIWQAFKDVPYSFFESVNNTIFKKCLSRLYMNSSSEKKLKNAWKNSSATSQQKLNFNVILYLLANEFITPKSSKTNNNFEKIVCSDTFYTFRDTNFAYCLRKFIKIKNQTVFDHLKCSFKQRHEIISRNTGLQELCIQKFLKEKKYFKNIFEHLPDIDLVVTELSREVSHFINSSTIIMPLMVEHLIKQGGILRPLAHLYGRYCDVDFIVNKFSKSNFDHNYVLCNGNSQHYLNYFLCYVFAVQIETYSLINFDTQSCFNLLHSKTFKNLPSLAQQEIKQLMIQHSLKYHNDDEIRKFMQKITTMNPVSLNIFQMLRKNPKLASFLYSGLGAVLGFSGSKIVLKANALINDTIKNPWLRYGASGLNIGIIAFAHYKLYEKLFRSDIMIHILQAHQPDFKFLNNGASMLGGNIIGCLAGAAHSRYKSH